MAPIFQPGILAPVCPHGRSISFAMPPDADPGPALKYLRKGFNPNWGVVGLGEPLVRALGHAIPGLRSFPALSGAPHAIPSVQHVLWVFLRGEDRGVIFDLSQKVFELLEGGFELSDAIETFAYAGGRDLTGYQDGTANPGPEESVEVAIAGKGGAARRLQLCRCAALGA